MTQRLLFITSNRLGDAVLSTGVLDHLLQIYPHARITIACGAVAAPLFRAVPGVERIIPLVKRRWAGHWIDLWLRTIGTVWHLVVDLRNSAVSRLVVACQRKIGANPAPTCHRIEHLGRVFGLAMPPAPRLWFAPSDLETAARLIPPGPPVLALGPAANWRGKTWRAERFAAVAAELTAPGGIFAGGRVAVLAAANEQEQARQVLDTIDPFRRIDLVGDTDVLVAAACLARCALFIGNDSGLMHLAAAVGTPTLGLFGPSRPEHYAPWGAHCAVVTTALAFDQLVGGPGYDFRTTGTLMDSLPVPWVIEAANTLWCRLKPAPVPVQSSAPPPPDPCFG